MHAHAQLKLALLLVALAAPGAFAQTPQPSAPLPLPKFDVISVKPDKNTPGGAYGLVTTEFTADGFRGTNVPIHLLLQQAYGLHEGQIVDEPAWAKTEVFDIEAKVAAPDVAAFSQLPAGQRQAMFQQILAERFNLAAHRDTRELPVYALSIANPKTGGKLKESPPDPAHPGAGSGGRVGMSTGRIVAQHTTTSDLASMLSRQLGRTVIDRTGLTAAYDFTLLWSPDNEAASSPGSASMPSDAPPSIFTAVQEQLGLKLESTKGPVDVIVIDHIEKPSEN
ncbi:MAG: TIGR03435 family protein [Acidobacteriaceae bacterium]|jgi:uncharacterized protein (TIGR03435 family)